MSSLSQTNIEERVFDLTQFLELKDVDAIEFFRLIDMPYPVRENWKHYAKILYDSKIVSESTFSDFLIYVDHVKQGFGCNTTDYRKHYASVSFDRWFDKYLPIISSYSKKDVSFQRFDIRNQHHGYELVSYDLKEANWSSIRTILKESSSLELDDWSKTCSSIFILPFLYRSKYFRQFQIGKNGIEPILANLQKSIVAEELDHISAFHNGCSIDKIPGLVFVSHDEIVMRKGAHPFAVSNNSPFRQTIYATSQLPVGHIRYEFDYVDSEPVQNKILMKGVPSKLFYPYLRAHILQEPMKEKDLEFMEEGRKARWVDFDPSKK